MLDMPTLFNDIEEVALKIEAEQTKEVITVSEYTKKETCTKRKTYRLFVIIMPV